MKITIKDMQNIIDKSYTNIKIKEVKYSDFDFFKQTELVFEIDGLNDNFHIGIDTKYLKNFAQLEYIIGEYLREEILSHYIKGVK